MLFYRGGESDVADFYASARLREKCIKTTFLPDNCNFFEQKHALTCLYGVNVLKLNAEKIKEKTK